MGTRQVWTKRLAAAATACAGVATIASSLSPNAPARSRLLEGLEPSSAQAAAHALGVAGGLATLWLALGVLHGRRSAGRAAIAVLGVLAVVHAAKGLDYEEALLALALAAVLYRALVRGGTSRPLLAALVALVVIGAAYALSLGVLLVSGHSAHLGPSLVGAARDIAGLAPGVAASGVVRTALHVLTAVAIAGVVLALRALLAPARASDGHTCTEHERAAGLVAAHGTDSIAPFALRSDKAFHFAGGGMLAYRTLRETAVVAGDPVGPPGCGPEVVGSFLAAARRRGWDLVLLGATEERLDEYHRLGLRTMRVGLEAVVDPRAFTLAGGQMKTVRKAVARVERHGWTIEVVAGGELGGELTAELLAVETAWRRTRRRLQGFAMAGDRLWGAPEDAADLYAIARNPAGEVRAFQRYVRYRRGLSLDAMRRLDDEPNGISDALVVALLERARAEGCEEVSLNFAGFGHLMAADALERRSHRLARWALRRLHGRFQMERLTRFAEKFRPAWRPRYMVYTSRTRLPIAALRIMQAEAYLRPPSVRPRQEAWLPAPSPLSTASPTPTGA